MRPDAQIFLALLAVAVLCVPLWIFWKARRNGGVAELPSFLMFGWVGAAWGQTCIVIDRETWKRGALIAHERCHQRQMARDGTLRFYWRYFTSKQARQDYEVEAYRVWVQYDPGDVYLCANSLVNSYGLKISLPAAVQLLKNDV